MEHRGYLTDIQVTTNSFQNQLECYQFKDPVWRTAVHEVSKSRTRLSN